MLCRAVATLPRGRGSQPIPVAPGGRADPPAPWPRDGQIDPIGPLIGSSTRLDPSSRTDPVNICDHATPNNEAPRDGPVDLPCLNSTCEASGADAHDVENGAEGCRTKKCRVHRASSTPIWKSQLAGRSRFAPTWRIEITIEGQAGRPLEVQGGTTPLCRARARIGYQGDVRRLVRKATGPTRSAPPSVRRRDRLNVQVRAAIHAAIRSATSSRPPVSK